MFTLLADLLWLTLPWPMLVDCPSLLGEAPQDPRAPLQGIPLLHGDLGVRSPLRARKRKSMILQCAQCLLDMRWLQGWALGRMHAHTFCCYCCLLVLIHHTPPVRPIRHPKL
jgi:hypothetical protein